MSETLAAALRRITRLLAEAGLETPGRDARALVAFAAGMAPMALTVQAERLLSGHEARTLEVAVQDRLRHRPVAQIIGRRAFWGRDFRVTADVLDPRPETEEIVALALEGRAVQRVLDLGTGSGILAVTLAAEWPDAFAVATDLSPAALAIARENAQILGVGDRVEFLQGDWYAPVTGRFGLVVSNPPYIPEAEMASLAADVREWEPHSALTPGGDGLGAYRAIAAGALAHLEPGGRMLLEFGAGQGADVAAIIAAAGFSCHLHRDMSGRERVLEATQKQ